MRTLGDFSAAAALIGDSARVNIMSALMDEDGEIGASDLANVAGVAPSTASEHLGRLLEACLVAVRKDGRKRFYRIAGPVVADTLAANARVAARLAQRPDGGRDAKDADVLHARRCCDHLSGRAGGLIANGMLAKSYIALKPEGPALMPAGAAWFAAPGIDLESAARGPRRFLRLCPGWCETHVGGALGAALLAGMLRLGWVRKRAGTIALDVTHEGVARLRAEFGFDARPESL